MATETERRQAFIGQMIPFALRWQTESGIPASILLAIMGSESNFGNAPSLFGIQAPGDMGSAALATHEVYDGVNTPTTGNFGVNSTPDAAFHQFIDLISGNASKDAAQRYGPAWQQFQQDHDPMRLLQGITQGGYATDKTWPLLIANIAQNQVAPVLAQASASAVPSSPPQGNPPMSENSQITRDQLAQAGVHIAVTQAGIEHATVYIDGQRTDIWFTPDGVGHTFVGPDGNPITTQYDANGDIIPGAASQEAAFKNQYSSLIQDYKLANYQGHEDNKPVNTSTDTGPTINGKPVQGNGSAAGGAATNGFNSTPAVKTPSTATMAAAGVPVPAISAIQGQAASTGGKVPADALVPPGSGGTLPITRPGGLTVGNGGSTKPFVPPAPTGYIPPRQVVPSPGAIPNTLNEGAVPGKGIPYYTGNEARTHGLPVLVSNSPGSMSVASPSAGYGENPFAIQMADKGLGSFGLPPEGASLSQVQVAALQENPYSLNNPLEQARLSGGLTKDPSFVSSGNGTTVHYANGGGIAFDPSAENSGPAGGLPGPRFDEQMGGVPQQVYRGVGVANGNSYPGNLGPDYQQLQAQAQAAAKAAQELSHNMVYGPRVGGQVFNPNATLDASQIDDRRGMPFIPSPPPPSYWNPPHNPVPAGYAHGGGLSIHGPAHLVDDATGQTLATFVDSRNHTPETLYDHGTGISVMNHAAPSMHPDNPNTGMMRFATGGSFGENGTQYTDTPVGGGSFDSSSNDTSASNPAPIPTPSLTSSPAPVATPVPTPAATSVTPSYNYTLPTAPTAPSLATANQASGITSLNGSASNPSYSDPMLTNAQAYEQNYNNYLQQLAGLDSGNAQQRLDALNNLNNANPADTQAIGAAQHARDITDPKYGMAGLSKPIDLMPPIGSSGLGLGSPGPGLRYALLTPEDQYNRMNSRLATAGSALSGLITSSRQIAELQHSQFLNMINPGGGSSSGSSSSRSSSTGGGGLPPVANQVFAVNRGVSG